LRRTVDYENVYLALDRLLHDRTVVPLDDSVTELLGSEWRFNDLGYLAESR
jgi:hypothetical protein